MSISMNDSNGRPLILAGVDIGAMLIVSATSLRNSKAGSNGHGSHFTDVNETFSSQLCLDDISSTDKGGCDKFELGNIGHHAPSTNNLCKRRAGNVDVCLWMVA